MPFMSRYICQAPSSVDYEKLMGATD